MVLWLKRARGVSTRAVAAAINWASDKHDSKRSGPSRRFSGYRAVISGITIQQFALVAKYSCNGDGIDLNIAIRDSDAQFDAAMLRNWLTIAQRNNVC